MKDFDSRLNAGWWALRIGLGVGPIITGIDKYFNKLADWGMYLSSLATKVVPISATNFMHVIGVVEILAGLVVLSRWTKWGSYIVMFWLLGIAVNLLGHSHPAVADAVARQSAKLIHTSNLYYSEPQVALAKRLVELSFPSRVFFCNSGAEANEAAIKIAHKWGKQHKGGAFEIITAEKSFHGRTMGAVAASGAT